MRKFLFEYLLVNVITNLFDHKQILNLKNLPFSLKLDLLFVEHRARVSTMKNVCKD